MSEKMYRRHLASGRGPQVSADVMQGRQDVRPVDVAPAGRVSKRDQVVLRVPEEPGASDRVAHHRLLGELTLGNGLGPSLWRLFERELKELVGGDPVTVIQLANPIIRQLSRELKLVVRDAG